MTSEDGHIHHPHSAPEDLSLSGSPHSNPVAWGQLLTHLFMRN